MSAGQTKRYRIRDIFDSSLINAHHNTEFISTRCYVILTREEPRSGQRGRSQGLITGSYAELSQVQLKAANEARVLVSKASIYSGVTTGTWCQEH